jgi:hypothetical protein
VVEQPNGAAAVIVQQALGLVPVFGVEDEQLQQLRRRRRGW